MLLLSIFRFILQHNDTRIYCSHDLSTVPYGFTTIKERNSREICTISLQDGGRRDGTAHRFAELHYSITHSNIFCSPIHILIWILVEQNKILVLVFWSRIKKKTLIKTAVLQTLQTMHPLELTRQNNWRSNPTQMTHNTDSTTWNSNIKNLSRFRIRSSVPFSFPTCNILLILQFFVGWESFSINKVSATILLASHYVGEPAFNCQFLVFLEQPLPSSVRR